MQVDPSPLAEEWRPVVDYDGLYEVSSLGRIRRLRKDPRVEPWKLLKPYPQWHGYLLVCLYRNNIRRAYSVHSLVAVAFIGPRPAGLEVNHIDTDKANNRRSNLEYVTRQQNLDHAEHLGLSRRGERNGKAKLTEADIRVIRASTETQMTLAKRYGVAQSIISSIRLRKHWGHVH